MISGSFAERDLHLKAVYVFSPPCTEVLCCDEEYIYKNMYTLRRLYIARCFKTLIILRVLRIICSIMLYIK